MPRVVPQRRQPEGQVPHRRLLRQDGAQLPPPRLPPRQDAARLRPQLPQRQDAAERLPPRLPRRSSSTNQLAAIALLSQEGRLIATRSIGGWFPLRNISDLARFARTPLLTQEGYFFSPSGLLRISVDAV